MKQRVSLAIGCAYPDAMSAQLVGHLGKYVPGKAMVVVIRAGRLSGKGVPVLSGSIAVFLETLLMMAVGAAVAGVLVFVLPVSRWIAWAALLGGIAATVPTFPPILKWVVRKVSSARGDQNADAQQEASLDGESLSVVSHDWRFFFLWRGSGNWSHGP